MQILFIHIKNQPSVLKNVSIKIFPVSLLHSSKTNITKCKFAKNLKYRATQIKTATSINLK